MDDRLPTQLSGGQQQRVAVARALAHRPKVLLIDEPFGALDAKIREELRRTIRQIQRELGITTILVTHDQEEAFALADRIGVMHQGRLLECGKPDDLYTRPQTRFVATFLGAANLLLGYRTRGGMQFTEPQTTDCDDVAAAGVRCGAATGGSRARRRYGSRQVDAVGHARVEEVVFGGAVERLRVRMLDGGSVATARGADQGGPDSGTLLEVTRTLPEKRLLPVATGQQIAVGARRVHVLPTPVSSFCVVGATEDECARLTNLPLLQLLATRMQTRVRNRLVPSLTQGDGGLARHGRAPGRRDRRVGYVRTVARGVAAHERLVATLRDASRFAAAHARR